MARTIDTWLKKMTIVYVEEFGSMMAVAKFFNVNYGLVHGSYNHSYSSPTLKKSYRKYMDVERTRYCFECTKQEREYWDYVRGKMTRHEFFVMLINKAVL